MKKKWIKVCSVPDSERTNDIYYSEMGSSDRLATMKFLTNVFSSYKTTTRRKMKFQRDYQDLLRLLNRHGVKYCIVGSFALAFYARPRFTKDLDIFVAADPVNAAKIIEALNDFGFSSLKLQAKDFMRKGRIVQLGYEPVRVDILTSIDGCVFDAVWRTRKTGCYGDQRAYFIGLESFIKNKKASNRLQDKADLEILLRIRKKRR